MPSVDTPRGGCRRSASRCRRKGLTQVSQLLWVAASLESKQIRLLTTLPRGNLQLWETFSYCVNSLCCDWVCNKGWGSLTSGGRWKDLGMRPLRTGSKWTSRWTIGRSSGTLGHHGPHTSGRPRGMKQRPRDTAPHGFRRVLTQRGEFLVKQS